MPGVPSSRACDECRKQRKSCHAANSTPQCSRCHRLGISCVGRGKQRFKFMDEGKQLTARNRRPTTDGCTNSGSPNEPFAVGRPSFELANSLTRLIAALASSIDASADIKIQLPWNFGGFLSDIPRRLGTNDALDAASQALVTSYTHFIAGDVVATSDVLIKHSNALRALSRCLDDPIKAYSSETLCSTMVLMIVQTLPGLNGNLARSHSVGAAQVLKGRGYTGPKDEFESKLLLSLRGPVSLKAIEGLISNEVSMTPKQWKDFVYNPLDIDSMDGQMMKCLAHLPDLMYRGRHALKSPILQGSSLNDIQKEARILRKSFGPQLDSLRRRWEDTGSSMAMQGPEFTRFKAIIHAHYSRSYGLALAIGIIINCVLAALESNNAELSEESSDLSDKVLSLADVVDQYRPLGTLYMAFCLATAWVGAANPTGRKIVEKRLVDYQKDIQGSSTTASRTWLEDLERRVSLN